MPNSVEFSWDCAELLLMLVPLHRAAPTEVGVDPAHTFKTSERFSFIQWPPKLVPLLWLVCCGRMERIILSDMPLLAPC